MFDSFAICLECKRHNAQLVETPCSSFFSLSLRKEESSEDVRLLHLVMNWRPSLTNSRGISRNSFAWSIVRDVLCVMGR
jgi:hypothetical protein